MSVQIIPCQHDGVGLGIVSGHRFEELRQVCFRPSFAGFASTTAGKRLDCAKDAAGAMPHVFVILLFIAAGFGREGFSGLAVHFKGEPVNASHRALWIKRTLIYVQDILHGSCKVSASFLGRHQQVLL